MFCGYSSEVGPALIVKMVALTFSDCTAKTDSSYHADEVCLGPWT